MFEKDERQRGAALLEYVVGVALFAVVSTGAIGAFNSAIRADLADFAGSAPIVVVGDEIPAEEPAPPAEEPVPPAEEPVPPAEEPVPPAEEPVKPKTHTFEAADAGTVEVKVQGQTLTLVDVDEEKRWTATVLVETDGEVVVRFQKNRELVTIRIVAKDGKAYASVTETKAEK